MPDTERAGASPSARARVIELLYVDDCPHYAPLLERLRGLVGADDRIQLRRIDDQRAADRERFLGSPTVRVNGYDVEPGAADRREFGMSCRLYTTAEGLLPTPPDQWLVRALRGSG